MIRCYKCQKYMTTNQTVKEHKDPELETVEYVCINCGTVLQHRYKQKDLFAKVDKM